jgi:diphosphomevalonate decarboxylase
VRGKVTVEVPANIAFVKYWGARDLERAIPVNASISMTLSRCVSRSTVEALADGAPDEVWLAADDGSLSLAGESFSRRVHAHLETLRQQLGSHAGFRVGTRNSFPAAAGLASSASGFAALALAVARALGREPDRPELSRLARLSGSGSAARSVFGGYVEWPEEGSDGDGPAVPLAPSEHWDLRDVIAIVETGAKEVSSLEGHRRAPSSPYFDRRLALLPARLDTVRRAIAACDLATLGPVLEEEAIDLHLIAMSSRPPVFYWNPGSVAVLGAVRDLRRDGIAAFSTMDAGANVHVICEAADEPRVAAALAGVPGVESVISDGVGPGPAPAPHLF